MKKSSKKFAISTERKNLKGFRVKTAGIDITGYKQNPIMLMMHERPTGKNKNEAGVIGNFVDLHFADNKLFGTPSFDDTDDYALKLYNKVENNVMRMCSAGLIPLKWGKDEAGDIWLLESKLFEVSLADVGSNSESLAVSLCDEAGELITLSLEQIQENFKTEINMKIIELSAGAVALGLSKELTDEASVGAAIEKLVQLAADKDAKLVTLNGELETAVTAKKDAEDALANHVKLAETEADKALVTLAHKAGKFVAGDIPKYEKLMAAAPEATKELLEGMLPQKTVLEQLSASEEGANPLLKLTYDQLDKSGQLETLKAENIVVFKEKFKQKFNKEYQG